MNNQIKQSKITPLHYIINRIFVNLCSIGGLRHVGLLGGEVVGVAVGVVVGVSVGPAVGVGVMVGVGENVEGKRP